jgi:GNAT superfamily N-acetyltransferase
MALASVRPAVPDDADAIARVQRTVWTSAYADLLPPGAVEGFDEVAVARGWAAPIAVGAVWVATEGDALVGFCAAGPASPEDLADAGGAVPDDVAAVAVVAALLVEPRWGRRGHAGRLVVETATALRASGAARGVAWVPERDTASRRFWERAGWEPDGTVRTLDAGGRPLREIRVAGDLDLEFRPEPSLGDLDLPLLS